LNEGGDQGGSNSELTQPSMATNGLVPDLPEALSKPPEGVVLPPKDIRAIVEKTAVYVERNGRVFEDRIREKEKHNPKFSFLSANDAYSAFYMWRLAEVKEGRGNQVSAGRSGEGAQVTEDKPKGPTAPPEFQFSARMPNISAQDLEIVKLTALHVARKGRSWMTALSQREARNFQFDFLRPQHSLYQFFSRLVDQYTLLLQVGSEGQKAEQKRIQELQKNVQDKFQILERAKQRGAWVKYQEAQKQQKEEDDEAERIAYAQIDWHDFVVVETVEFTDADDTAEVPPPTSLNDLQSASLEQKAMMSLARPDMRIEEAMPTDDTTGYYDPYGQEAQLQPYNPSPSPYSTSQQPQHHLLPYAPTPPPSTRPPQSQTGLGTSANNVSLPSRPEATPSPHPPSIPAQSSTIASPPASSPVAAASANAAAPMRIRSDYVPLAQQRSKANPATASAICPNCAQSVLLSELDKHLQIELLDPRWKEQRAKADSRFASTNLGGTDVAANLKRLRARTGGESSDPVAQAATRVLEKQEEEVESGGGAEADERRKRLKGLDGTYDAPGTSQYPAPLVDQQKKQPAPVGQSQMSVQEQIKNIHQKFKS
jgi:splicing factor 3A subunit 1